MSQLDIARTRLSRLLLQVTLPFASKCKGLVAIEEERAAVSSTAGQAAGFAAHLRSRDPEK